MEAPMLLIKWLWSLTMFGLNDDCDGGESSGDGDNNHGDNSTIGENSGDSVYCRIGDNDEKDFYLLINFCVWCWPSLRNGNATVKRVKGQNKDCPHHFIFLSTLSE